LWKGHQDSAKEVLLFMDSREDLFEEVERVVKKLHSYETFILVALPAIKSSKGVSDWMRHELK
jgi:uncharacterized protein involved in tolerance to divalent cations